MSIKRDKLDLTSFKGYRKFVVIVLFYQTIIGLLLLATVLVGQDVSVINMSIGIVIISIYDFVLLIYLPIHEKRKEQKDWSV